MNEKSIQRLKRKFVMTAMISFFLVMLFIAGCIFAVNLSMTRTQIRHIIEYIESNDGVLPEQDFAAIHHERQEQEAPDDIAGQIQELFGFTELNESPEYYYSTRYFSVLFDADGNMDRVIISHIASVEEEEAVELAQQLRGRFFRFGSYGTYYYKVSDRSQGGMIVTVMDSAMQIQISHRIIMISLILIGFGLLISFQVLRVFAGRLVKPEIRSAELQKSFITNASHELKTPLAVIRANTEMQEMSGQESEWTKSTMRQVDRMTGLINNLVAITRAQEKDAREDRVPADLSAAVRETVETFVPVAQQDGKQLRSQIAEGITMLSQEGDIRQLATILVDNAVKYCDDRGTIEVLLTQKKGRKGGITLAVSNPYEDGGSRDYSRFFDRFYRGDESHNTDKGGFGIGLSIAQSLMERYRGDIRADWKDGVITFTCFFPQ